MMYTNRIFCAFLILGMIFLLAGTAMSQNTPSESGPTGSKFIPKMEAKLGKPLTNAQKMQFRNAALQWRDGMNSSVNTFAQKLSTITGIQLEEIKGWMPRIGYSGEAYKKDVISKIETKLGKKLTTEQMDQVMKASGEKKEAMKAVNQQFVDKLTEITGLKKEDLTQMLPQMDTHVREKQGNQRRPQQEEQ